MKPINFVIFIQQESTWELETTFRDPDGAAVDLSDFSAELRIRSSVASPDSILTLTDENGGILLSADDPGNLILRISATQTGDLPTNNREVEDWAYDLKIWQNSDPDYTTTRLLEGRVNVSPAVSREDEE